MPVRRIWTEDERAELRRMIDDKASTSAMARRFGTSRQFMGKFIGALGYVPKKAPSGLVHWDMPSAVPEPAILAPEREKERWPLPAGHPDTWGIINLGTCLEGQEYPR